jgi:hypothetical protein
MSAIELSSVNGANARAAVPFNLEDRTPQSALAAATGFQAGAAAVLA